MKILHISHRDSGGGAATAARRLHTALKEAGVDSKMLVTSMCGQNDGVLKISTGWRSLQWKFLKKFSRFLELLQFDPPTAFYSLNLFQNETLKHIRHLRPDIVHLHWIGGETLRIEDIALIEQPIVWTLHDMWPFSGAEHLDLSTENTRWKSGYTKKNRPPNSFGLDWNRKVWERKFKAWKNISMSAICLSEWSENCLNESMLKKVGAFENVHRIPNGLNLGEFKLLNKRESQEQLGIPVGQPVLLFAAHQLNIASKGASLLYAALEDYGRTHKFILMTIGSGRIKCPKAVKTIHLGNITRAESLNHVFSAADLTVIPSRIESFGLVAIESLACGTPVVCFDSTGLKDVVGHKSEGYRAKAFDPVDFSNGIRWCLEDPERYQDLVANGRSKVESNFSMETVLEQHLEVYRGLLAEKTNQRQ